MKRTGMAMAGVVAAMGFVASPAFAGVKAAPKPKVLSSGVETGELMSAVSGQGMAAKADKWVVDSRDSMYDRSQYTRFRLHQPLMGSQSLTGALAEKEKLGRRSASAEDGGLTAVKPAGKLGLTMPARGQDSAKIELSGGTVDDSTSAGKGASSLSGSFDGKLNLGPNTIIVCPKGDLLERHVRRIDLEEVEAAGGSLTIEAKAAARTRMHVFVGESAVPSASVASDVDGKMILQLRRSAFPAHSAGPIPIVIRFEAIDVRGS